MEGALPPDLEGTLVRVGPGDGAAGTPPGALHAVELREGKAVSYVRQDSPADAGVFWHAGALLALPEAGLPLQYSLSLEPQEFTGGLTVPVSSHVHRVAADGARVLFAVDDAEATQDGGEGVFLRLGEWDAQGSLRHSQSVVLERATWQHDVGVTASHVVFIESPTERLSLSPRESSDAGVDGDEARVPMVPRVPFGWVPGADTWLGVVPRAGDGSSVRWFRVDPCLVTHVLGARENDGGDAGAGDIVLYVCRYEAPEAGQPVDRGASVVADGIGLSPIGGSLPLLERWRLSGDRLDRTVLDDRHVEYPRIDAFCEGGSFRYGYAVELAWQRASETGLGTDSAAVSPVGLLKFDFDRDETVPWHPRPGTAPSEPLFVRAADGHNDEEGWLLCLVDDAQRGATDLVVLDASSLGRRSPEAVIHLPARLPLRAHGEWVPADRYR